MIDPQDPESPEPVPPASARPPRSRLRARVGPETRERRRRILRYGLAAGAVMLMVNALVGENGYLANVRARREHAAVASEVNRLRLENQLLLDQARRLKDDPLALEDAARRDLGLIRPGETLVIVRNAKTTAQ